jgi:hypothetical protein
MIAIDSANFFEDEAIVEFDPEYADMGNPSGAIYGRKIFIHAVTAEGARYVLGHVFEADEEDRAARLVDKILRAGAINEAHWGETYAVYGSTYWQDEDRERQFAWDANPATRGTVRDY